MQHQKNDGLMGRAQGIPVTAVVPIKNEEKNLKSCLASLTEFREILVVDSGSTDKSTEIARDHGAKVIQFEWDGRYPKKRNWVLQNYDFVTEWVLFIDADEVVDQKFCSELMGAVSQSGCVGFWLTYTNHFMGRKLRFGIPQRKLACFKTNAGRYERIEEERWSTLDMEIHEHPVLEGELGRISAPIMHNDFRGLSRFLERHISYAEWEAARFLALNQKDIEKDSDLTRRQRIKYANIEKFWFAWFYFFYAYIAKFGFLDGTAGYHYARYKKWYFEMIRLLIAERRQSSHRID